MSPLRTSHFYPTSYWMHHAGYILANTRKKEKEVKGLHDCLHRKLQNIYQKYVLELVCEFGKFTGYKVYFL